MPTVAYRVTRSRQAFVNAPKVKAVLAAALDDEVKPHFVAAFDDVVANWTNKPAFKGRKFITTDALRVDIYPTGKAKDIYKYVTGGTRPHIIVPVRARRLSFLWGGPGSYKAKTAPGGVWGGPGIVMGGKPQARSIVHHPGNAPRDFEGVIRKRESSWFSRTMENAWRRAIRAMSSSG